jgi:hypothetical protein
MAKFHGVVEAVIAGTPRECRPEERGGLGDVRVTHEGRSDRLGAMHVVTRVTTGVLGLVEAEFVAGGFRGPARAGA